MTSAANSSFLSAGGGKGKRKSACSDCMGRVTTCRACGEKLEVMRNGIKTNYREGTVHRCRGRRY